MTDVLDTTTAGEMPAPHPEPRVDGDGTDLGAGRALVAALLVGAAAIHLAMAPSHLGLSGVEGAGFLAAAWAQLGLAVAVLVRPSRAVLAAGIAVNLVLVATWLVSRTSGLPVGAHEGVAEAVSFVDAACVALEIAAVLLAGALLLGPAAALWRSTGLAVAGALGAFVLTTGAIASPSARDHAAGGHAAEADAHGHGADGAEDDLGFSALQNGQMGDHEHGPSATPRSDEIDATTAAELAQQLALTAPLVEAYPTLGAARRAGHWQAGPFSPGLGTHYTPRDYGLTNTDGDMDPEDIANPVLIYDGIEDDAPLAGFMYMIYQETEPEGFAGPLDRWHFHTQVCMVVTADGIRTPFGADLTGVTDAMCAAEGGTILEFTGYMVHVWTVPGYESDLGTFSDLNPKITCPDGTYHAIPISEIGDTASTCKDP